MKIAYIGSPSFSATILRRLHDNRQALNIEIISVITQPDKPVGRKKITTPTAVKQTAEELSLPVSTNLSVLKENTPDLVILFAYGKIIPQWSLDLPHFGFWNIHPSLLPQFRGASPISYPLMLGEPITGVTIMQMDADLDHGDIILQAEYIIQPEDSQLTLQKNLTNLSYSKLEELLLKLKNNEQISKKEQSHSSATHTRPLDKKDGFIPFDVVKAAYEGCTLPHAQLPEVLKDWYIRNKLIPENEFNAAKVVNAMSKGLKGWPGIWTTILVNGDEKRLVIHDVGIENNTLVIKSVQLEGKTQVEFTTFNSSYTIL